MSQHVTYCQYDHVLFLEKIVKKIAIRRDIIMTNKKVSVGKDVFLTHSK